MNHDDPTTRTWTRAIVGGLIAWGLILAVGAFWGLWAGTWSEGGQPDVRRFLVVVATTSLFLLFWGGAMAVRKRRLAKRALTADAKKQDAT